MMRDQTALVLASDGNRISQQGDMPIRISRHTLGMLMRALGLGSWEWGDGDFREIDALALDALRHLAWNIRPSIGDARMARGEERHGAPASQFDLTRHQFCRSAKPGKTSRWLERWKVIPVQKPPAAKNRLQCIASMGYVDFTSPQSF